MTDTTTAPGTATSALAIGPLPQPQRWLHLAAALVILSVCLDAGIDAGRTRPSDGAVWLLGRPEVIIREVPPRPGLPPSPLRAGDVVLGIGNRLVHSPQEAARILNRQKVGTTVTYLVRRDGRLLRVPVHLTGFHTGDRYYLYYTFLALAYWIIGLLVYWRGRDRTAAQLFFWMCLLFTVFFMTNLGGASYFWSDLLVQNIGALARFLLPALFLHFFLVFPERKIALTRWPWLEPLLYAVPLLFYFRFTVDQFVGQHAPRIYNTRWLVLGIYFSGGVLALLHSYLHLRDPLQRNRLRILTIGTLGGVLPFLVFTVLPAGRVTSDVAFLGIAPMIAVPLSFAYSIARYRVMQIEWLLRRSLLYNLLSGLVLAVYLALVLGLGLQLSRLLGPGNQLVSVLVTIAAAALLWPARRAIQGDLDRRFFRSRSNLASVLREIGQEIPRLIQLEDLVDRVGTRLCQLLDIPRLGLYVPDGDDAWVLARSVVHRRQGDDDVREPAPCPQRLHLAATARRLVQADEPYWVAGGTAPLEMPAAATPSQVELASRLRERERLAAAGFALLVPLRVHERLVGCLALPAKRTGDDYQLQDMELLQAVAGQMALQLENSRLYAEELEKQRLEQQLALARTIQSRLLPRELPRREDVDLAACNISSAEVSGDYYDVIERPDGRLAIVISDVSGKGVPASLLASNLQAALRAHCENLDSPAAILHRLNLYLHRNTEAEHFATLFLAFYDPAARTLFYSNGGHNPPLLLRADGSLVELDHGGPPLGAFDFVGYEEQTVGLEDGDTLLLYTDGLTESRDTRAVEFGDARVRQLLRRHRDLPAGELLATIRRELNDYCGQERLDDDVTLIVMKIHPAPVARDGDQESAAASRRHDRSVT